MEAYTYGTSGNPTYHREELGLPFVLLQNTTGLDLILVLARTNLDIFTLVSQHMLLEF